MTVALRGHRCCIYKEISLSSICLDIDGVISDICASINKRLESDYNLYNYDYSDWLITNYEDPITKKIFGSKLFWKNLKPFDDAWYSINKWWSIGHDIHLVTSRQDPSGRDILETWLDEWRFQYNQFHFSAMGEKIEIIKEINPIFVIEDNPHEVKILTESGIDCFLRRAWYNSDFWEDFDTIGSLFDIEIK